MLATLSYSTLAACFRLLSLNRSETVLVDRELCSILLEPSGLETVPFAVEENRRLASVLAGVFSQRASLQHMPGEVWRPSQGAQSKSMERLEPN